MGDTQKWSVTYTKHVKQKRKVYQDGYLELHCSNGTDKIFLYDDCEKLLESRFLKKEELVGCGETLTFGSYLVDIGSLDKSSTNSVPGSSDAQGRAPENPSTARFTIKKENRKCGFGVNATSVNPPNVKHILADSSNSQGRERRKSGLGHCVAPQNRQTVGFNIKKENEECGFGNIAAPVNRPTTKDKDKRTDLGKYEGPDSSARDNMQREWRVLYTAQKTQKAKKYHDGVLRLVVGVFDRKQVFLYDDCGKQLDSRYVKADEILRSGGTLTFEAYLVDIGDPEETCKPLPDLNSHGREKNPTDSDGRLEGSGKGDGGSGNSVAPEICASVTENVRKEWHILYTTQKTQKAKKYHDGILRLLIGVSHRKQVILVSEDGTLLSSKYLSSTEDVRTGSRLELANHLVEIGEACNYQEGEVQDDITSGTGVSSCSSISIVRGMKPHFRGSRDKSTTHGPQGSANSGRDFGACSSSARVEKVKFSETGLDSRSLEADEILDSVTLTHEFYLVDTADPEENCKPLPDLNVHGMTKISTENVGRFEGSSKDGSGNSIASENCASVTQNVGKEWHILYTTQKTQKAKKYHDGFLRLLMGVNHRKQVVLLSEDGSLLSSKYLSSTEDIRTGSRLELASHLVEVGEARNSQQVLKPPYKVEKVKFNPTGLRNVDQILSTLMRPPTTVVEEKKSVCPVVKEPVAIVSSRKDNSVEEDFEDYLDILKSVGDSQEFTKNSKPEESHMPPNVESSIPVCEEERSQEDKNEFPSFDLGF